MQAQETSLRHVVSPTLEIALVIIAALASVSVGIATVFAIAQAVAPFG